MFININNTSPAGIVSSNIWGGMSFLCSCYKRDGEETVEYARKKGMSFISEKGYVGNSLPEEYSGVFVSQFVWEREMYKGEKGRRIAWYKWADVGEGKEGGKRLRYVLYKTFPYVCREIIMKFPSLKREEEGR